jgi:hypothetical protein
MSSIPDPRGAPNEPAVANPVDLREALFNEGAVGPAGVIQVPTAGITRLNGLMLDLDPKWLVPDNALFPPADDPREFLARIAPVLDRHPLLRHAEVRSSGGGLHAILWFDPPVELTSAAAQARWSTLVRAVQCALPGDPNAPGITALTRPVGSVNSKNGAVVAVLRPGQPVDPARVEAFVRELAAAPFRRVAAVLLGGDRAEPCPVCRKPGSSLAVLDRGGKCYACGPVSLEHLFEVVYRAVDAEADWEEAGKEAPPSSPKAAPKRKAAALKPRGPGRTKARPARRTAV